MSKTIDDVLNSHLNAVHSGGKRIRVDGERFWVERNTKDIKQALYELFEAEAETIELTHKDDTRIWRQAKKYVSLDTIAKLLGVTNADQ